MGCTGVSGHFFSRLAEKAFLGPTFCESLPNSSIAQRKNLPKKIVLLNTVCYKV
jgi:hypothetical protein